MEEVVTIGLDIAKSVFQVHGINSRGEVVLRRQLKRARMLPFFDKLSDAGGRGDGCDPLCQVRGTGG